MKGILLMVITLGIAIFATARQGPLVISASGLKKLQLGDNMKVMLVGSENYQADTSGIMDFYEKLNVSVSNGTMKITGSTKLSNSDTVIVVTDALESLTLGQYTQVNTDGTLRGTDLDVFVETGAVARLLTTGKVHAFSLDETDVQVDKQPVRFKVSVKVM